MPNARAGLALVRAAALTLPALFAGAASVAAQAVFLNEIHYDNSGTDAGEAIEVAGPAGTDLTGWSIVLYNGSGGASYDTDALVGTIPDLGGGFGVVTLTYPSNGIQNGAPDGIALVSPGNVVAEFLCYEGTFSAVGGPAGGQLCIDLGVDQDPAPSVGLSLQRIGTGACGSDFVWTDTGAASFGAINAGQSLAGTCVVTAADPKINEFSASTTGTDVEYLEIFGDPSTDYSGFTLLEIEGDSGSALGVVDEVRAVGATDGDGFWLVSLPANALENGTLTLLLVEGFTGALGNDLDTDDDGDLDVTPWDRVVDAVAVNDGGAGDRTYGVPALGVAYDGLSFAPGGGSRVPDGTDTDAAGDWVRNDFDLAGIAAGTPVFGEAYNTPGETNVAVPFPLVINEIHADPDTADGDANGDGVANFSADEFVEIVNTDSSARDLSGWTLADGAATRHTFPAGSVIAPGCALVVFGGGVPAGTFGGALVQVATGTQLGLNNGGDTVTLTDGTDTVAVAYGAEGGDNQSITRDPDLTGTTLVKHTLAAGAGEALFSPGTRADGGLFAGCALDALEIHDIQGAGAASPYTGQTVRSDDNTVTAVGPNGFVVQTPPARVDADPQTSQGLFVFTGAAPGVAVGDQVDVTGRVEEFFGMTELSGAVVVTKDSSGNPLPSPILLGPADPSPNPASPTCGAIAGGGIEENNYECREAMLVQIVGATVGGASQSFGSDPIAEVHVVAGPSRPFREPGAVYPGLGGSIPVFDGNPEVFELDPDRLGLANVAIPAGSSLDAVGVIGYEFSDYEIWATQLAVSPVPVLEPVRDRAADELTVGSLNLFRLFDDVDDPPSVDFQGDDRDDTVVSSAEYQRRREKLARYILEVMKAPDVLAVQEAESRIVLEQLAAAIATADPSVVYTAYLEEGNDPGTIDNGFLVLDTVVVDSVEQLGYDEVHTFDGDVLNDRPPLLLVGEYTGDGPSVPFGVMCIHGRSLGSIESPTQGPRVRNKRLEQAESAARFVQEFQEERPFALLAVVGDFNAYEFTDGYVDVTGHMKGDFDPAESLLSGSDHVDPDLTDRAFDLAAGERYSYVFAGSAQVLDHALTSVHLDPFVRDVQYARGNADAPGILIQDATTAARSSDHDGLVLFLESDDDGVPDALDLCPGTEIPEAVPTRRLSPGNWALTENDGVFRSGESKGGGNGPSGGYTIFDTGGCSCDQIIDEMGLGFGHERYGCSTSAMDAWVARVAAP